MSGSTASGNTASGNTASGNTASGNTGSPKTESPKTESPKTGETVARTVRLWHRILVDRIAESRWLRGRSGRDAAWFHYERHARVAARTAAGHAGAQSRAQRLAEHEPPRILVRWQEAIGRLMERQGK
jgi:hypothetical protein